MQKAMIGALAIGTIGLMIGATGLLLVMQTNDKLTQLSDNSDTRLRQNANATETYHFQQVQIDNNTDGRLKELARQVDAYHTEQVRNNADASARLAELSRPYMGLGYSYSCYSPWLSPEQFTVPVSWVNFGEETAHSVSFVFAFHWAGGTSHTETTAIGNVTGRTMGQFTFTASFETGGCGGVTMDPPGVYYS